jgi:serine/threonine-protein kinase RsbW
MSDSKKENVHGVRITIDSVLEDTVLVGAAVHSICTRRYHLEGTEASRVEVAVVEAVNNAVEHAYGSKPGNQVVVDIELGETSVVFRVQDRGQSIPSDKFRPREEPLFDPDDYSTLPERGMGLFIMRQVMDEISYQSTDEGNELRLEKDFSVDTAEES